MAELAISPILNGALKEKLMPVLSAGANFRAALKAESPLQVIGATTAHHALLAKRAGFAAIYLKG